MGDGEDGMNPPVGRQIQAICQSSNSLENRKWASKLLSELGGCDAASVKAQQHPVSDIEVFWLVLSIVVMLHGHLSKLD
jgi:hypothetical protein